jgi:glutathione S-transferase
MSRFRLHHAPGSRSARILWLLEEAGADYDIAWHDLEQATQKRPDFLALNPAGKLPVLEDRGPSGDWRGVAVVESAGICAYVADVLPEAGLAPAIGTPERAAYATWLAWCAGVLEPAATDLAFPRSVTPPARALGWPPFAEVVSQLEAALDEGPWLLGARFSAADVLIGSMVEWLMGWGKLPSEGALQRYAARLGERPARQRARARESRATG